MVLTLHTLPRRSGLDRQIDRQLNLNSVGPTLRALSNKEDREKIEQLESRLHSERLAKKAAIRELKLFESTVREQASLLKAQARELKKAKKRLAEVPWRAVSIYRTFRLFIPTPLVRASATLFDRLRRR